MEGKGASSLFGHRQILSSIGKVLEDKKNMDVSKPKAYDYDGRWMQYWSPREVG